MLSISRGQVPTQTGKTLYDLLAKSWDNGEFIYTVLMRLSGDENKQKLIDFIKDEDILNEEDSSSLINQASLMISEGSFDSL